MPSNNCAVIGCDTKYINKNIIRHRFPKDEKTCAAWVQKSGNNNLFNKSALQIFNSYIICDKHFDASCKSPGYKKLINGSIPTLYLPAADISDTEVKDYAEPSTSTFMDMFIDMNHSDVYFSVIDMSIEQSLEPLNSTIDNMSITQTDDITWQTPNEEVQELLNTNQSLNEAI